MFRPQMPMNFYRCLCATNARLDPVAPPFPVNTFKRQTPGEGLTREAPELRETVDRVHEIASIRQRHDDGALRRTDWVSALTLGWGFIAVAISLAVFGGNVTTTDATHVWSWIGLVALYALAHDTVFAAATGSAVPTQPILVAMLLTVPLNLVPILLLAGVLLGAMLNASSARFTYRIALEAIAAWHCMGPVLVLAAFGNPSPSLSHWPIYLLAIGAQFVTDAIVAVVRTLALGSSVRSLAAPMIWTFGIDLMLAPIGLTAVLAAGARPELLILLAAPLGMIRLLAQDRSAHLEQALTLGTAYVEVSTQARVDSMTGIANRRGWEEALEALEQDVLDGRVSQIDVVMADLDHLKITNDRYGHQAGDDLIREAAALIRRMAPAGAFVARLGGDEFGVLIPDPASPLAATRMVADLRAAMDPTREPPLSISLGVAAAPPCSTITDAVEVADTAAALDKASRRAGRDLQAVTPRRRAADTQAPPSERQPSAGRSDS